MSEMNVLLIIGAYLPVIIAFIAGIRWFTSLETSQKLLKQELEHVKENHLTVFTDLKDQMSRLQSAIEKLTDKINEK